jgi:predicted RNase H-like HicB family nuclease
MRYVVYIESRPAGFEAYVPDIPGCAVSAETREEALQRIRESVAAHHEALPVSRNRRRTRAPSEVVAVNLA